MNRHLINTITLISVMSMGIQTYATTDNISVGRETASVQTQSTIPNSSMRGNPDATQHWCIDKVRYNTRSCSVSVTSYHDNGYVHFRGETGNINYAVISPSNNFSKSIPS